MAVKEIRDDSFNESISSGVSIVDFYADWCGPCKMLSPILKEISEENDKVSFLKINVDENQQSASQSTVSSLPTLVVYKDGEEVNRLIGLQKKEAILSALKV